MGKAGKMEKVGNQGSNYFVGVFFGWRVFGEFAQG